LSQSRISAGEEADVDEVEGVCGPGLVLVCVVDIEGYVGRYTHLGWMGVISVPKTSKLRYRSAKSLKASDIG